MKRLHVCHVLTDANVGGAGKALKTLLDNADRERFVFSVILPRGSALLPLISDTDAQVFELSGIADRSNAPGAFFALGRLIRSLAPDIVHTHASLTARAAARLFGVSTIIMTRHCHTGERTTHTPFGGIKKLASRWLCTRAIAVGEGARRDLIACGIPDSRIDVICNGAPPLREVPGAETEALRRRLGIPENACTVGIFGRLEACKGHEIFLNAAQLCAARDPDMRFLAVGDGSRRRELEELAVSLGIDDRVIFCGFCDDIAPYMSLCQINVNTSMPGEAASLAVIEGMSLGVVPIMSDCEDRDTLIGGCGIAFPAGSASGAAEAIMRLRRDDELTRHLSAAAKEKYRTELSAQDYARKIERVYLAAMSDIAKASAHTHRRS